MAQWQRHICLQPEWGQAKRGEITEQQLAGTIAEKLSLVRPFKNTSIDTRLIDIASEFKEFSEDNSPYEFNDLMEELYEWGDISLDREWNGKKVAWIDTWIDIATED